VAFIPLKSYGALDLGLVYKTPAPILAGFKRLDNRVLRLMEMFGRVFMNGTIAASYVPAFQAKPQVHPGRSDFQAILTSLS
jgi:hypothetical protein